MLKEILTTIIGINNLNIKMALTFVIRIWN